jgi:hypothetical protein
MTTSKHEEQAASDAERDPVIEALRQAAAQDLAAMLQVSKPQEPMKRKGDTSAQ